MIRELQARRRQQLGVAALRPWDLSVDPLNRPALRPFADTDAMERGRRSSLIGWIRSSRAASRPCATCGCWTRQPEGKGTGRLPKHAAESRPPFIFMNAVGLQRDVETILHEAGHAFHALATHATNRSMPIAAPIEF